MNLINLFVLLIIIAFLSHLIQAWRRPASVFVLFGTVLLVWSSAYASANSFEIFGVTLALESTSRDFLTLALGLTGALALATTFQRARGGFGFLFAIWLPWFIALTVSDFIVAVFMWMLGAVITIFAMKPRQTLRAGGAVYFLVIIVIGGASLLLANRFVLLYPLTADHSVLNLAVMFLAWGFGLWLALFPFQLWVGPLTDDAPLPISAMLLAVGQPIGLWLLVRLLSQYSWLGDKSNLFEIIALGGAATAIVGGVMAVFERRAERLLGYAAMFGLGLALLDLSHATREAVTYAGMEIVARALSLTAFVCALMIGRAIDNRRVQRVSLAVFLLSGLNLVGLRFGVSLAERWNLLTQLAGSDPRLLVLIILAHLGLLVGILRFAKVWHLREWADEEVVEARAHSFAETMTTRVELFFARVVQSLPHIVRGRLRTIGQTWRVWASIGLLLTFCALLLSFAIVPQLWFERMLTSLGQLSFVK